MMDDDDADHTLMGSSSSSKKQKYRPLHSEPLVVDSKLAVYLKEEWAFGRMSPQQAQLIAKHACSDLTSALAFGKKLGICFLGSAENYLAQAYNDAGDMVFDITQSRPICLLILLYGRATLTLGEHGASPGRG